MKNKHKGLKIFGAIAGIAAICCIVPACVVSCGSSSNSSTSSTTNTPTLPTSLDGTTLSDVADNWSSAYGNYASSSNYNSWMESNLQNYAKNAPSYFNHLATSYDSLANINTMITSESLANSTGSSLASMPSSSSSSPLPTIKETKTNLAGYLPLSYTLNYSTMGQAMNNSTTYWLKLDSDTLSNLTVNDNNQFSFTLTSDYSVYEETSEMGTDVLTSLGTQTVVQTVKDATFASTILTPLTTTLNANTKSVKVAAGWYMNACTANTFNYPDLSEIIGGASAIKSEISSISSLAQMDSTSSMNGTTLTAATKFSNPTASSKINAPLVSGFYNNLANCIANTINESLNGMSNVTTNLKDFQANAWLNSFAIDGLAGYAFNNDSQISSSNAIDNINSSLMSNLSNQVNFQITMKSTMSSSNSPLPSSSTNGSTPIPMPSGSAGTTPIPSSNPTGTSGTNPMPNTTKPTSSSTSSYSLPTSLTGSTYNDVNNAWSQAFANEEKTSNYSSWMQSNVKTYAEDAVTNFEMLATEYDAMTKQVTSINSKASLVAATPNSVTPAGSSYSTTGYLPFASSTDEYENTTPVSTVSQNYWLKLTNETVRNWTANTNDTFSFTITSTYDVYMVEEGIVIPATWTITQNITDATFAPTLLTSGLPDSLSPTTVSLNAGWYMSKCSTDTFTMPSPSATSAYVPSASLVTENSATLNAATSYTNPTSSTFFSAPLITNFYDAFSTYMENSLITQYKNEATVTSNQSTVNENTWFSTFMQSGIAGYALNMSDQISSSSKIQNPISDTTMASLTTPINFEIKATLHL